MNDLHILKEVKIFDDLCFTNSKSKEINNFYKKNKISPSDDNELKMLFVEFFEFLNL